jgi:hypothetical protein
MRVNGLRADRLADRRDPAVEQTVSAFKSETAELYLVPIVESAHAGDRGVVDDGADLETKILKRNEFRSKLACQRRIRPIGLAESTNRFRFDFLLPQLSHIAALGKAEKEISIDIACMYFGG